MSFKGIFINCEDLGYEYPFIFFISESSWIENHKDGEITPLPGRKNRDYVLSRAKLFHTVNGMGHRLSSIQSSLVLAKDGPVDIVDFDTIEKKIIAAEDTELIYYNRIMIAYRNVSDAVQFRLMID